MDLAHFGLVPHNSATIPPGRKFGRLTVVAVGKPPNTYRYTAICMCECGSEPITVRVDGLTSGGVVSCGCYHREVSRTHGLSKHPLYQVWRHMRMRCENPDDAAYPNYGGRGITVCKRWQKVENFVADMEAGYAPGLEIDRIDNDGDYKPSNCRWATPSENSDNRRSGHRITFNGKTQSIRRWAKETGISYGTLWERIAIWGWSPEKALTTPPLSGEERMRKARRARWGDHLPT